MLHEIERMSFTLQQTGQTFTADPSYRPIVVLTSNSEKDLPDAFMRRCVFYHLSFPDHQRLTEIVSRRLGRHLRMSPERVDEGHSVSLGELDRQLVRLKRFDYGTGPMVRDPKSKKYRRTRLFAFTLGCSRKSVGF